MTTKYLADQEAALADLKEAGTEITVSFEPMEAYDPVTGRALRDDGEDSVVTYGILTSVNRYVRELVPETLTERVRFGATLASLPLVTAGRELKLNALLRVAGVPYRILGIGVVQPDGAPIIHKLALEAA